MYEFFATFCEIPLATPLLLSVHPAAADVTNVTFVCYAVVDPAVADVSEAVGDPAFAFEYAVADVQMLAGVPDPASNYCSYFLLLTTLLWLASMLLLNFLGTISGALTVSGIVTR